MSHVPQRSISETIRLKEEADEVLVDERPLTSFAYVDTPDFCYDQWLQNNPERLGGARGKVLVVGGGVSGAVAAYELDRAGCRVTVLEAEPQIGGRCTSTHFPAEPFSPNLVELGAMRFPPSMFTMSYYLDKFGITKGGLSELPLFPDPGMVATWLVLGDKSVLWTMESIRAGLAPEGFEKVHDGWVALVKNGITKNGMQVLQTPATIQSKLCAAAQGDEKALADATRYWQAYLTAFGNRSFYEVLVDLFTGSSPYDIPGSISGEPPRVWTFEDFDTFGTLGIGSGGFGSLYPISFIEIWRLIVNGLEDQQRFLKVGVRTLPETLLASCQNVSVHCGVQVTAIHGNKEIGFTYEAFSSKRLKRETFDRVVIATTTRSMEVTMNVTTQFRDTPGSSRLLDKATATAIKRTHVISAGKVALRIKKFWKDDESTPRVLLCDNLVRQVYTVDYGDPEGAAICFITYAWDDDAVKHQGMGIDPRNSTSDTIDKGRLFEQLYKRLEICGRMNPNLAKWVKHIQPFSGSTDDILFVEWQSKPNFNGAFKLSFPGQDQYVKTMFFDYLKAGTDEDTGLFLAGDCIAWTSGWVEGALQTGLNATAAVIRSLGGVLHGRSPMDIKKDRFDYFSVKGNLIDVAETDLESRKRARR